VDGRARLGQALLVQGLAQRSVRCLFLTNP